MKKLLIIPLLFLSLITFAQGNFLVEDGKVIWRKVYESETDVYKLTQALKSTGNFKEVEGSTDQITGSFENVDADLKAAGYSRATAPIYISTSFFSGSYVVDMKDGKYRVSIKNIMLTSKNDDPFSKMGQKETLTSYVVNKSNQFKPHFINTGSKILDKTFLNMFELNGKVADEW